MAIYLEIPQLHPQFPFQTLFNEGDILTPPHWHKELEIIYVKKGIIHMGIGEESIDAKEGEFVIVASGRVHYVLASPGSIRFVYQFDENFFCDLMQEQQEQQELHSLRNLWRDYPAHSKKWMSDMAVSTSVFLDAIYEEDHTQKYAYSFAVKGYMCLMILGMYRNKEYHRNEKQRDYQVETCIALERLDLIFRYVEEHYMHHISLENVANHIGFSPSYFTRFFKKSVGKTFVQFLNEYRIDKAKWILLNGDIPTTEMVERIGIGSTKSYYRLFKEIVGISPKEYQRNKTKGNI